MKPPHNVEVATGTPTQGVVDEIENPNARAGTNSWYGEDGYGGGSYSDCADTASRASVRW